MKQNKRKLSFALLLGLVSGSILILSLMFYVIPTETRELKGISLSEYMNIVYLNNHPKFNYLYGLWMIPAGLLFFSMMIILEIPDIFSYIPEIKLLLKKK